jgi:hypothetical protein
MNKLIIAALVALSIIGCQTIKSGFQPTETQLVQDEKDVQTAARIATRVYILSVDDKNDRYNIEKFANTTAKDIVDQIDSGKLNLDGVTTYINNLVTKSNLKHKEAVGLLLDSLEVVVQERINSDLNSLVGDARAKATLALVKSAATGVLEATSVLPTTQP